ncbi:MAG: hypothetical protein V2B18_17580 [Pseudomonadota bacterium]
MKYVHTLLFCLLVGSFVATDCPVSSYIAPIVFEGGPLARFGHHGSIRLDTSMATIRLKRYSYTVDAVLGFFNTGAITTLLVGVKKMGSGQVPRLPGEDYSTYEFLSFQAWVDGRKTEFADPRVSASSTAGVAGDFDPPARNSGSKWLASRVTFRANATVKIRLKYEVGYQSGGSTRHGYYYLGSGRNWKGKIRKAVFIIDSTAIGGTKNGGGGFSHLFLRAPESRKLGENLTYLEIEDFEPPLEGPIAEIFASN